MTTDALPNSRQHHPHLRALAVSALLVFGYLYARHTSGSPMGFAVAQGIYIVAPLCAFVLCLRVQFKGVDSRTRAFWRLMALTAAVLTVAEIAFVASVRGGGGFDGLWFAVYDGGVALATLSTGCALIVGTAVDRRGWRSILRVVIDIATLAVFAFAAFYTTVVTLRSPAVETAGERMQAAVYATVGITILIGVVVFARSVPLANTRSWNLLLAAGLGSIAVGALSWPLLLIASPNGDHGIADSANGLLVLIGYALVASAAYARLNSDEVRWFSRPGLIFGRLAWASVVVPTFVVGALIAVAVATARSSQGSEVEAVYLGALAATVIGLVGRTAAASAESFDLATISSRDADTGVGDATHLRLRIDDLVVASRRLDSGFGLVVIEVLEPEDSGADPTPPARDRVLMELGRALVGVLGSRDDVARLGGITFAAVVPHAVAERVAEVASGLVCAVESVSGPGGALRAHAGWALYPHHGTDRATLLRSTELAAAWARRQGRAVAAYDGRVVRESQAGGADTSASRVDLARALAAAADARDPANYRHSRNVASLAVLLAEELGLDQDRIRRVEVAAMLHDVGKIALPDTMLGAKTLSIRERRVAEDHAQLGASLVQSLGMAGVPAWVDAHHERWDGRGYPAGIAGERIPIEARIIALADAYDGMTTGKRYGAPMSKAAALQEIDLGLGSRFDPALAEVFIMVVGSTPSLGWADGWSTV